jgi:uncharacterized membrane protein
VVRLSKTTNRKKRPLTLEITLPYILLVGSIIGLIAAFVLTYDKIHVLQDPTYRPPCNINPIISCGSVMEKPQANLLGVPNTIYGLIGFSALATVAGLLIAGVKLPRRIWQLIEVGVTAGLLFAGYLFFQGVFRIHAICPYCFLIWVTMPAVFWYTSLYNLRQGYLTLRSGTTIFLNKHHGDVLLAWYVLFLGLLVVKFWYYWSTLL